MFAGVAQWIEQSRPKGKVGGSTPLAGTSFVGSCRLTKTTECSELASRCVRPARHNCGD